MKTTAFTALVFLIATPVAAELTAEHQRLFARYYSFGVDCIENGFKGQACDQQDALEPQIKAANICFEAERSPFYCAPSAPATAENGTVTFDYQSVKNTFNMLPTPDRKSLQRYLKDAGFYGGSIDGAFGPGTAGAMEAMLEKISVERNIPFDMTNFEGVKNGFGYISTY